VRPDILALERAALTAVPASRFAFDRPFVLRAFAGGTGRTDAASALHPAPDPALGMQEAYRYVTRVRPRDGAEPLRFG